MKFKSIWTNYKIYAFIIGLLMGTLVYNLIGIDFYYYAIDKIQTIKFGKMLVYLLVINLKFWLIIVGLSVFKYKKIILFLVIVIEGFFIAGYISISIIIKKIIYLYEIPNSVSKIFGANLMLKEKKNITDVILSMIIILFGSLLSTFVACFI